MSADSDVESGLKLCCDAGWLGLKSSDYHQAVIRLASYTENKVSHLVFGWAELLPIEIVPPPYAGLSLNVGAGRFVFSRTVVPVADALAWYEAAWGGRLTVPVKLFPCSAGRLAPEPDMKRFVVHDDVPFAPEWHVMPRIHRLVAMEAPIGSLSELIAGMADVERFKAARRWLKERLHFDVLAYDDWIGGLALVLPNPLQRTSKAWLVPREQSEVVRVSVPARANMDLGTLSIHFQEHRAGTAGWCETVSVGPYGTASTEVPGTADAIAYKTVCSERGLLDYRESTPWVRSGVMRNIIDEGRRRVEVPKRRRSDEPHEQSSKIISPVSTVVTGILPQDALDQLRTLRMRRGNRTGPLRPLEVQALTEKLKLFCDDRAAAVAFIRAEISRARREVIFVDPYFNAIDLREFGLAVEEVGVSVVVLITPQITYLKNRPIGAPDGVETNGEWLDQEQQMLVANKEKLRIGEIKIVVPSGPGFHDRFLVVDDIVWQCGHSFNNVGGGEYSTMVKLANAGEFLALLRDQVASATPFTDYWRLVTATKAEPTWRNRVATWLRKCAFRLEQSDRVAVPSQAGSGQDT